MGKKLGLDAAYANLGKGYLQHPVINSVKPKPKPTKAMGGGMMRYDAGGMMQGYGAARTSGMGLEDQSLPPGKMVRASKGKMLTAKQKKLDKNNNGRIDGEDFKMMKAKHGKYMKK